MTISLAITERESAQKNRSVRASGGVPGNVYGPKQDPISISMDASELAKVIEEAGESTIVELTGLKEPLEVLVKDVDFDPVKRGIRHVDFYAIERGKEMTVTVPIEFVGEAPAEKNAFGSVTKVLHEVEVTCRPSDLPSELTVDISTLVDEQSKLTLADISLPEGVKLESELEETVAVISVAKEEEDEAPTEIDMDTIEVEEKGKGGAEGDAEGTETAEEKD
jgi:large subunit ribosomal protein L25